MQTHYLDDQQEAKVVEVMVVEVMVMVVRRVTNGKVVEVMVVEVMVTGIWRVVEVMVMGVRKMVEVMGVCRVVEVMVMRIWRVVEVMVMGVRRVREVKVEGWETMKIKVMVRGVVLVMLVRRLELHQLQEHSPFCLNLPF